jgi:hypothetical protein
MPKERRLAAPPEIKLPSLELESTGTGLLGMFTRGPAMERNAARQAYRDAVALGMDPAEAARLYGPQIMGPGFVPPPTQAQRQAEHGAFYQSLAREMFPAPETREVPTGAYQVEPVLGPQGQRLETEVFAPRQYEPVPEAPGPFQGPFTATPTGEPIPTYRQVGPALQPYRREPIERQRVLEPEVRPEIFQPPTPTHAQLLATRPPSQVAMFEQAYPELLKRRQEAEEQQALAALGPAAAPGAPAAPPAAPAPGAPPAVEGAAPAALSPTARVEAAYEPVLQRLRANPRVLVSETGKNYLERYRKDQEAAEKAEEAQAKRATAGQVQAFQGVAQRRAEAAETAGDLDQATYWRGVAANPTQYLPQEKERAERAEKAEATRQRRDIFGQMADAETDPQRKQVYRLAQVDQKTAEEVGQMLAQSGKPVELKGQMYRYVQTPEGGLALERLPGGPPEEAERPTVIEGQAFRTVMTPEGPRLTPYPGAPTPKAKPWYGLSRPEAEAIRRDPSRSPEERRIAGEVADALQTGAERAAAAAVAPVGAAGVKWTAQEAEDISQSLATIKSLGELRQMVTARPELVGGPGGLYAKGRRVGEVLGVKSPEFQKIRAKSQVVASGLRRAMSGLAVVAHEGEYLKWIPDPLTQSGPELLANLEATEENTRRLLEYRVRIRQGDPTLPLLATPEGNKVLGPPGTPGAAPAAPGRAGGAPPTGGAVTPVPGGGTLRRLPD